MKHPLIFATLLALAAPIPPAAAEGNIVVTIKPLHSLVQAVLGEHGEAQLLVDGAASVHGYTLKPSQVSALHEADLVFYVHKDLESFLPAEVLASDTARAAAEVSDLLPTRHRQRHGKGRRHKWLKWLGDDDHHDDHDDDHHRHGKHGHDDDHDDDHSKYRDHDDDDHGHDDDHDDDHRRRGKHKHDDDDHDHDDHHEHDDDDDHDHDDHHEHDDDDDHDHDDHHEHDDDDDHGHGKHGRHHDHGEHDLHVWLDIENARRIAQMVTDVLSAHDPDHAADYRANNVALRKRLATLDEKIAKQLEEVDSEHYVVFHDAYQYMEARYGLRRPTVLLISPNVPPSAKRLKRVHRRIEKRDIHCAFREPQFSDKAIRAIAGDSVRVGELDPLGSTLPASADMYEKWLTQMADNMHKCMAHDH